MYSNIFLLIFGVTVNELQRTGSYHRDFYGFLSTFYLHFPHDSFYKTLNPNASPGLPITQFSTRFFCSHVHFFSSTNCSMVGTSRSLNSSVSWRMFSIIPTRITPPVQEKINPLSKDFETGCPLWQSYNFFVIFSREFTKYSDGNHEHVFA